MAVDRTDDSSLVHPHGAAPGDCAGAPSGAVELFDEFAEDYDRQLADALSVSGESREYFSEGRVAWLGRCLREMGEQPLALLDYGCGDGATTPVLMNLLGGESAIGIDVSEKSIEVARKVRSTAQIDFEVTCKYRPAARIDLAYCNGVFHHIPLDDRARCVDFIYAALKPGGLFSFWENNPWNPAARYVAAHCAFERGSVMVSPPAARDMLRAGGFKILRTDFRFIFPRFLRLLRGIEDVVYRLPLGAQYQHLCRKAD